jgi:hypothetical protein
MPLTVAHEIREGYFWIGVTGRWELREIFRVIDTVRGQTELAGHDRVFVDLRGVDGPIPALDRFFAGERVAAVLGPVIRLAVFARPALIDKFGENTAVNRGARILVTGKMSEALAFLA